MAEYFLSRQALDDLQIIRRAIEQDNPEAAVRVMAAAQRVCQLLAEHPEFGRRREFSKRKLAGIRSFVVTEYPNYVVFYRIASGAVEVVRVLHGARNIDEALGES